MQLNLLPELDNLNRHLPAAHYQKSQLQAYQGNELIEALPVLGSADDIYNRLVSLQTELINSSDLSAHERAQLLCMAIEDFFFPTDQHFELLFKYDLMLRQGYSKRSITDIPSMEDRRASAKLLFVKGTAGEGKTQAILRIGNMYDQVISHKEYGKAQVVHIEMKCPVEPTVKSFCYSFFESMQRATKTDAMTSAFRIRNEHELFYAVKYSVERFHLGILVIDDIENLFSGSSPQGLIRKIVELSESTGLPIVLSGSNESEGLFKSHAKITFDVLGMGTLDWKLLPLVKIENGQCIPSTENWEKFVSALWKYQVVTAPETSVPSDFCEALYELSQGIPKVAISLFVATQLKALYSQKDKMTVQLLKQVEKKEFGLVRTQMSVLKRQDSLALRSYKGLTLPSVDTLMFTFKEEVEHHTTRDDKSNQSRVLNFLVDKKVDVEIAKEVATRITSDFPEIPIEVALEKVANWLQDNEKDVVTEQELNKRVKKRKVTDEDKQDIDSTLSDASRVRDDKNDDWFSEW
ncbi:TniB family NTP-binding protein [Shewanella olleyana]|uniref:AAA family ATPase n=1 Tax=Shewanella olleyana TaxID=135626 RepID=UPI00200EBD7D|nr:AAA family ATPase [Shewanella olleyana]MCL1068002.1 TniB family NTP-binding protein [Shewanella olleyana]